MRPARAPITASKWPWPLTVAWMCLIHLMGVVPGGPNLQGGLEAEELKQVQAPTVCQTLLALSVSIPQLCVAGIMWLHFTCEDMRALRSELACPVTQPGKAEQGSQPWGWSPTSALEVVSLRRPGGLEGPLCSSCRLGQGRSATWLVTSRPSRSCPSSGMREGAPGLRLGCSGPALREPRSP